MDEPLEQSQHDSNNVTPPSIPIRQEGDGEIGTADPSTDNTRNANLSDAIRARARGFDEAIPREILDALDAARTAFEGGNAVEAAEILTRLRPSPKEVSHTHVAWLNQLAAQDGLKPDHEYWLRAFVS